MSVPAPQEPRHDGGRWETIRYALDSNARTFRLCLICLVLIAAPATAALAAELIRHMLLCGCPAARIVQIGELAQDWPGRGPDAGRGTTHDHSVSAGAAEIHCGRAERYRQDREAWRARLRQYHGSRPSTPETHIELILSAYGRV